MDLTKNTFLANISSSTAVSWELCKFLKRKNLHDSACLILVPDNQAAFQLRDDLEFFSPTLKSYFLPAFETDLLRNRGPSIEKRVERLAFFTALHMELWRQEPSVFFVSVESLNQLAPKPSFWTKNTVKISKGAECSRSDLAKKLLDLGYLSAELVEQPTQYAVRGSIIDAYSPLLDNPVRLELFEDVVQSIRLFHPDSQRKIAELEHVYFPPAREFLFVDDPKVNEKIRSDLRKILDDDDWLKKDREAFLTRIDQKSFFSSVDYWGPLLDRASYPQDFSTPLFEKFAFCIEPQSIEAALIGHRVELEKNFLTSHIEAEWVPKADHFCTPKAAIAKQIPAFLTNADLFSSVSSLGPAAQTHEKLFSAVHTHHLLSSRLQSKLSVHAEGPVEEFSQELAVWKNSGLKIVLIANNSTQLERLEFLLSPYQISFSVCPSWTEALSSTHPITACTGTLTEGFSDVESKLVAFTDEELFGSRKKRSPRKTSQGRAAFHQDFALLDLKPGDLVVSKEHGIGRFLGLKLMSPAGFPTELLEIEYKDSAKLFVPVTRLNTIQKHSSSTDAAALDRLGGSTWEQKKSRVKKHLQSLAGELLHLYSLRAMAKGPEICPPEKPVLEFAAGFAFEETPDQMKAIEETLRDLRGPRPMDRLVCGDVGYGKTEVAIRAAHAAVCAGYQVALLCPTTILAAQHENTFRRRFTPLGIVVAGASRFKTSKEIKETFEKLKTKKCDIVIGTHKLLSHDVGFANLGLLVIDEEQRFGVAHKEKIKKLRSNVHILSMTATPIPRTLNMAMGGLKDLSIITSPPLNRLSVRTHVSRKKEELLREAIEFEVKRGGQIFYVHNRVQTIGKELEYLKKIVPKTCEISCVHGQMDEKVIEERMLDFYEGRSQILLATSIIESGLDVPNANTLIVDRADTFGLAQLYQIRGRVGRSNQRAYAYFLIPEKGKITDDAEERLSILDAYQELGSGFHIASYDLEIRGSGDILGREQSGQLSSIGFDAYMELLQECVAEIKGEQLQHKIDPEIQIGLDTTIPESFIPEFGLRLVFYRRLAAADDDHEISHIEEELEDRFGSFPQSVKNLIHSMRIKCQLRRLGVRGLSAGKNGYSVAFDSSTKVNPAKMVRAVQKYPAHFQLSPEGRLLIKRPSNTNETEKIMRGVESALSEVESWLE